MIYLWPLKNSEKIAARCWFTSLAFLTDSNSILHQNFLNDFFSFVSLMIVERGAEDVIISSRIVGSSNLPEMFSVFWFSGWEHPHQRFSGTKMGTSLLFWHYRLEDKILRPHQHGDMDDIVILLCTAKYDFFFNTTWGRRSRSAA